MSEEEKEEVSQEAFKVIKEQASKNGWRLEDMPSALIKSMLDCFIAGALFSVEKVTKMLNEEKSHE